MGIFFVIMGHIGFGGLFSKWIHAFHMPMFFIVSGFFFNGKRDWKQFLLHGVKTLIVPYAVYGIVLLTIAYFFLGLAVQEIPYIMLHMNSDRADIASPLWFLMALFFAECFYYFIWKIAKKEKSISIVVLGVTLIGKRCFPAPFSLDTACVAVGFLHVGYL